MTRDELLDTLGAQKKRAFGHRKLCKEILDSAGREQKSFQPDFERLNSEQTTASGWVRYWNEQLASSRREHSRNGVEYCKGKAQEYRNELTRIREARQALIFKQRAAKSGFQTALNNFRAAQAECNRLVKAYDDRVTELREQNQRARDDRYQQRSGWQPGGRHGSPDVGVIAGTDQQVSFKTNEHKDQVLIRDGDYGNHDNSEEGRRRAEEFNKRGHHDHYGDDSRTGERFEKKRDYHDNSSYKDS